MGLYIRKGFNFGPLRVNFSKSGVGLSFGIKGLRVGSGPKGNYVHAGRKGIYYKKSLPNLSDNNEQMRLSWPVLVIAAIVIGGLYFYLRADGDFAVMKELLLKQLEM